ncbi:hypothetical protein AB0N06_23330 [Streptomyces sp. NPDC051020]|uniref:hypothetical protein n=1 Tax=Streptomyces sp. NPDC051020 TaxID=3155409 RepID=UPI00343D362A
MIDLLVDYLTERAVDVDCTTLEDMARALADLFWRGLEQHHPGIDSHRQARRAEPPHSALYGDQPLREVTSSVSWGTTWKRSPTMP